MNSSLDDLLDTVLDGRTKGFPQGAPPLRLRDVGSRGWSLLRGDLDTPVALLKATALDANIAWMSEFLRRAGVSLCPHGKTTMAPQLFHRQLAAGAWGITVATPQQARVAYEFGVKRILLANELVSDGAIASLQNLLDGDPALDFTCLVDSLDGVRRLESARGRRPFQVLLEVGIPGGRTGARDEEAALAVARAVKTSPRVQLRGVECFEGIVTSADGAADRDKVQGWLDVLAAVALRCDGEDLFETDEVLLTAGGSAYFDVVAAALSPLELRRATRVLLRSGCYAFHDVAHYAQLVGRLERRLPEAWRIPGRLRPAVEVWGRVLSRPEPGLAFLDLGKRDVGQDLDLPRPLLWARPGQSAEPLQDGWKIASLYDQHARVVVPASVELAVGDLVGCGISHPCTTFDKWQLLFVVDDEYRVVDAVRTFF
jgi:D-serine deaminase-like pyridoxal phosphate-dependent protein